MPKPIGPPKKLAQTPTGRWAFYLVALPWLQLVTGVLLIAYAKSRPSALSLFEGATISTYAVALLAGTVCAFDSPAPPPISKFLRVVTERVFLCVVVCSVVFVVMNQSNNILSTQAFLGAQGLLMLIAMPFSWRARA